MITLDFPRMPLSLMIDIGRHQGEGWTPATKIAERQQMSLSSVETMLAQLRRADLLAVYRGPGGGYRLAREPGEITVAQVVAAIPRHVGRWKDAHTRALGAEVWQAAEEAALRVLESTTLAALVGDVQPAKKTAAKAPEMPVRIRPTAPTSVFDLARQPIVERV